MEMFKNVLEILLPNVMGKHFKNIYNIYQYKSVESADFVYISESFITNYLIKMLRIKLFGSNKMTLTIFQWKLVGL